MKALQADWIVQWDEKYKASPIASPYTASVIFNSRLIINFMNKSVQGMTIQKSPDQPTGGGLRLTVLTDQFYVIEGMLNKELYHQECRTTVDEYLDDESNALHITLGQTGNPDSAPSAELDWAFSSYMEWYKWTHPVSSHFGRVDITNKLEKKMSVDDSDLPNYLLHIDVGIDSSDWDRPDIKSHGGVTGWEPSFATDALPSLPSTKVELITFKFFLTTNLLLPGSKVINFEKAPGARFPKDLYVVGHVTKK